MTYQIKPLPCDPVRIKGMSERMIISHYENNYGGAVIRRMLGVLTLAIVLPALVCGSAVSAQENFRLLGEKEIRARVIGKDITDASHWATYLRSDGVLMRNEIDHKWAGVWKIRNNKLCMSNPSSNCLLYTSPSPRDRT